MNRFNNLREMQKRQQRRLDLMTVLKCRRDATLTQDYKRINNDYLMNRYFIQSSNSKKLERK